MTQISRKSRWLEFCYLPATSACYFKGIFAAATNSTNQTNKAVGTLPLSSLCLFFIYTKQSILTSLLLSLPLCVYIKNNL
jgi:hypothetical protein